MQAHPIRYSFSARARIWAAPLMLQLSDRWDAFTQDMPALSRAASHAGLLLLTLLTIGVSGIPLNLNSKNEANIVPAPADLNAATTTSEEQDFIMRAPVPLTNIPKRLRRDAVKYSVKPGDTISGIAEDFEISADSVLWANAKLEDNPDLLSVGQVLNIPPVSGVMVMVQNGDTVAKLADKYKPPKSAPQALFDATVNLEFNKAHHELRAPDYALTPSEFLMLPGGYKPYVPRIVQAYSGSIPSGAARGTGAFGWPVSGIITQKYWTRHPGIDIGAPKGAPVYAADSGFVIRIGFSTDGYGNQVVISHQNGYVTRYAHLSAYHVEAGDSVKKGQMIGRVGSTGNSTGPHLHFEIIQGNGHRNPFALLPGR